ncbi:MAG TPA: hypothetical protein VF624_04340 [Tepidisphaeraceae bacterium]|jgi:hypothetical protein
MSPSGIIMLKSGGAERTTLYLFFLVGFQKYEMRDCKWRTIAHAQYRAAVEITGIPKGARIRRRFVGMTMPGPVILAGYGHPELPKNAGIILPHEFDAWLNAYTSAAGARVLADFRRHNFGGD